MKLRDSLSIKGIVTINTYRAGMVHAIQPFLKERRRLREAGMSTVEVDKDINTIKITRFLRTAVKCPNLVMDSPGYGLDLIIQRMVGTNTYSLNVLWIEIGTGNTTATLADTALTSPSVRVPVSFTQDYGTTDAIVQAYITDSDLPNDTYKEVGSFVDGTSSIGSGQIFNHALLSPAYTKASGQDTTIEIDFTLSNS
jgi:hypothetical protein